MAANEMERSQAIKIHLQESLLVLNVNSTSVAVR